MSTADIAEIKRFAVHDGDGIRTTVFFAGCPLRCLWCHNPETFTRTPRLMLYRHKCTGCGTCAALCACHSLGTDGHTVDRTACTGCGRCVRACPSEALSLSSRRMRTEEIAALLLRDREFYRNSDGGITLSGGECLCQADACVEILREMKKEGVNTAVDTCGFVPRTALDAVLPYTDTFLYDIKAMDGETHLRCTGRPNREITENLCYLLSRGARAEIRYPYVPGCNDGEAEAIARFLSALPPVVRVRVLPYHDYMRSKYAALDLPEHLPARLPTKEELAHAEQIFRAYGLPCGEDDGAKS